MAATLGGLTAAPAQSFTHTIDDGTIQFSLRYHPRSRCWYVDVEFEQFVVRGVRVVNSFNILDQFRNVIPFGLLVSVPDGFEPFLVNDFVSGRITLNVLSAAEVKEVHRIYEQATLPVRRAVRTEQIVVQGYLGVGDDVLGVLDGALDVFMVVDITVTA